MRIAMISFSQAGYTLGEHIHQQLIADGHEVKTYTKSKYTKKVLDESQIEEEIQSIRNVKHFAKPTDESLRHWASNHFVSEDALIFIGACGIAVRSIASYIKDKKRDPAVVVIDEKGKFAISLLSGHIGGANELTEELAKITGATPVVTTATDINHKFAVDVFARKNGFYISDMNFAKEVSAALLAGEEVGFISDFPWIGDMPEGLRVMDGSEEDKPELGILITNSYREHPFVHTLYLIPRVVTMGIGCQSGKTNKEIETVVRRVCDEELIPTVAMEQVVSIDLKKDEEGIIQYCKERQIPFVTYTREELEEVEGSFSGSEFVKAATGVDNVCERSAVRGSNQGILIRKKYAENGITVALAMKKWSVEFE